MSLVLKSKRGTVLDWLGILIALVVIVTGIFFGAVLFGEASPVIADVAGQNENVTRILGEGSNFFASTADNLVLFLFVGLSLAAIVSAVLSRAHPMFLFVAIFLALFMVVVSVVYSNWYAEFSADSVFVNVVPVMGKTGIIMNNLPTWSLSVMAVVIIVLYAVGRKRNVPQF